MPAGRISSATWCSFGPLVRRSKTPWAPGDTWGSISSAGRSPCWPRLDSARVPPFRTWARAGRSPPSWARSWSPTPRDQIRSVLIIFVFARVTFIPAALLIGVWFVLQLVSLGRVAATAQTGGVAYVAHVGGLVF